MATKKKETEVIVINPLKMRTTEIEVIGDSPLLVHAWSVKARREMLEKQMKLTKTETKSVKNPLEDFVSGAYWLTPMPTEFDLESVEKALENARFGFPCSAFKKAILSTSSRLGWGIAKTELNTAFFIEANEPGYYTSDLKLSDDKKKLIIIPNQYMTFGMVEIFSDTPVVREDMVRLAGMGRPADIRYRPEFRNWSAKLKITYVDDGLVSLEQIINGLDAAGKVNGIGEWRCERGGDYGKFHVNRVIA